jgi:hypothetical protein
MTTNTAIHELPTLSHAQLNMIDASTFNAFVKANGICADRESFHEFTSWMRVLRLDGGMDYIDLWLKFNKWGRQAMIDAEDAADLQDTQACAVR